MKVNDIAYFCGYFSTTDSDFGKILASDGFWTLCEYEPSQLEYWKGYYFPEFVDLFACQVKTYIHECNQEIQVKMKDESIRKAFLTDLKVYLYPFGIVMYSIGLRQYDLEMEETFGVLMSLRMVLAATGDSDFEKLAVAPLEELCKAAGASKLMESGNKYKLFRLVVSDQAPIEISASDKLLFSAGTMTMYDENANWSFSKGYYEKIISKGRLSVFKNWSALSLLDTFTILAFRPSDFTLNFWESDYFGKLYLYSLFRKFFLFRLNNSFREDRMRIGRLKDELESFEGEYSFPMVSYNFLPELVVKSMETGLDIDEEKEKISLMVTHEKDKKEAETNDRMNLFLGVISFLTLFSAIWDFGCLVAGMKVFGENKEVEVLRACTTLIIGIFCLVALKIKKGRK